MAWQRAGDIPPLLPEDPWLADWRQREPGPTRRDELASWERSSRRTIGVDERGEFTPPVDADPMPHDDTDRPTPPPPPAEAASRTRRPTRSRTKLLIHTLALAVGAAVWYFSLGTLVVSRGAALASGWEVTTPTSGSMAPAIAPGDLVAYAPVDPAELRPGQILVFDNPARPDTVLVHRLVSLNADGTLTNKGDANADIDSTPVPPGSIRGVVKMVAPLGGYPTMLLHRGDTLQFAALIAVLLMAAVIVHTPAPGDPAIGRRRRRRA